jgi:hypothetical protein
MDPLVVTQPLVEGGARLRPFGIAAGTPQSFPAASLAASSPTVQTYSRWPVPRQRVPAREASRRRALEITDAPHLADCRRLLRQPD